MYRVKNFALFVSFILVIVILLFWPSAQFWPLLAQALIIDIFSAMCVLMANSVNS